MGSSYRDLTVWQRSIELSVAIYDLTRKFPTEDLYGLTSQLRRAAVSVASNIAEGYGRASRPDFRRFVAIARGSVLEFQTQLIIAGRLGFATESRTRPVQRLTEETAKMLWALMEKLNNDRRLIPERDGRPS
jgi:four helix bundle protein